MNSKPGTASIVGQGPIRPRACAFLSRSAALLLSITFCVGLTGCLRFLKPAQPTARYYVLTAIADTKMATAASASMAVGLGRVKIPSYLFNTSLAVRQGTNEIEYLPSAIWAERLDTGLQRVLAANLATALRTDRIHLSAWQRADVDAEVYVTVEQFDVDATGRAVLIGRWRIHSPGGEKLLKAGISRLSRQGPSPDAGASGVVATLSELAADLSRELAQALHETTPVR